jgi:hypothetical protein
MRTRWTILLAMTWLLAACQKPVSGNQNDAGASGDGAVDAARIDANVSDAAPGDAGTPRPHPSCVVVDVSRETITTDPAAPRSGDLIYVFVTGTEALTNVAVTLCTPDGPVQAGYSNVTGSYTWEFRVDSDMPVGESQIIFSADPSGTVYSTKRITIGPPSTTQPDAGAAPGLCDLPVDNLLANGDFETGMDGRAPTDWQVRNPAAPADCAGSGTADQHVYIGSSAAQCGGSALVVDSRGQWDCYAVQIYTEYNTILGGHTYRVSAAVKSESQDNPAAWFVIGVQWLDQSDAVFGDEKNPQLADVNYDWTRLTWTLVAPSNARRAVVWLTAHYPGRVTYDKVSLVEEP